MTLDILDVPMPTPTEPAEYDGPVISCLYCALHGTIACGETVDTCQLCKVRGDVFVFRPDDVPIEVVCLDCLCNGKHMASTTHPPSPNDWIEGRQPSVNGKGQLGFWT